MPAFNFPSNPVDGQVYENYVYESARGVWNLRTVQVNSRFTVSATAPVDPINGDAWFDSTDGTTYIYYADSDSGQWVESGNPVLSYSNINTLGDVTITNVVEGQGLVYNGTEWVNGEVASGFSRQFLLGGM